MAQKIFFNWQDAVKSYEFYQSLLGIIWPGRYCGFDTKSSSGLALSLTHAASGIVQTTAAGSATTKTGLWINPQGSIIQENATVLIGNIAANSSGNSRIDLIVGNYLKPASASAVASYSIIQGTPAGSPVAPALTTPTQQVILGYLLVPDGTTANLTSCTFTPATIPLLGNEDRPVYSTVIVEQTANDWFGQDNLSSSQDLPIKIYNLAQKAFVFMVNFVNGTNSSQVITTLPVSLRPVVDYYIPIITSMDVDNSTQQSVLKITTAGVVTVLNPIDATDCRVHTKFLMISLENNVL